MQIRRWAGVALLAAGVVYPWQGKAQDQSTALTGIVVDASGAAVPGADVTVRTGSTVVTHATTDAQGRFSFSGASQDYAVDITAQAFRPIHEVTLTFTQGSLTHFTLQGDSIDRSGVNVSPVSPVLLQAAESNGKLVESPVRQEANRMPLELDAFFQGGVGLTENRGSFRFLLVGAHVGKVLTPELGTGPLRGNFEYAVEVIPYWQSFTPTFPRIKCPAVPSGTTVNPNTCSAPYTVGGPYSGVSITPIILRWNFTHGRRIMPWAQAAGGLLWTNHKYPGYGDTNPQDVNETGPNADTSVWNFTPQGGVGMHYFLRPRRSLDFGANAVHISSASLGDRNPGVNASVQFSVGYSWWK